MYRCKVCNRSSRPGAAQLRFVLFKPGRPRQIAAELPVCPSCHAALEDGVSLATLTAERAPPPVLDVQPEPEHDPALPAEPVPLAPVAVVLGAPSKAGKLIDKMRGRQWPF